MSGPAVEFRTPTPADASAVHALVLASQILDVNSTHHYALLFTEFSRTCMVAINSGGHVAGFVTGFRPPDRPDRLFVWQAAVAEGWQGQGLGRRMVMSILERDPGIRYLEGTMPPTNRRAENLFRAVAREKGAKVNVKRLLDAEVLGAGKEREDLYEVGPFTLV